MAFGFCQVQSANFDADYDQIGVKWRSKIRQTSIKNTNLFY